MKFLPCICIFSLVIFFTASSLAADTPPARGLIVKFKTSFPQSVETKRQYLRARLSNSNPRQLFDKGGDDSELKQIFLLPEANSGSEEIQKLIATGSFEYVLPNIRVKQHSLPNDTYVDPDQDGEWEFGTWGQKHEDLWGAKIIQTIDAWNIDSSECTNCRGEGVVVAVVDSGVDFHHPDISNNIWNNSDEIPDDGIDNDENGYIDDIRGWNFVFNDNNPNDFSGHGTHVAGTIASELNNNTGISGVAPRAKIMPISFIEAEGGGSIADGLLAIKYAVDNGADVVNNSWGCFTWCPDFQAFEDIVRYADQHGVALVFSAGNDSVPSQGMPVELNEPIVVGASTELDSLASFSSFGSRLSLSAPGGSVAGSSNILSLRAHFRPSWFGFAPPEIGDDMLLLSGTSMAAPHVTGVIALMLGRDPSLTPQKVKAILKATTDPMIDPNYYGSGRINALKALQYNDIPPIALIEPLRIENGNIEFRGTATSARFESYTLEYAHVNDPTNWIELSSSTTPVVDGTLGPSLLASDQAAGEIIVRLLLRELDGTLTEERRNMKLNDFEWLMLHEPYSAAKGERVSFDFLTRYPASNFSLEATYEDDPSTWFPVEADIVAKSSNYTGVHFSFEWIVEEEHLRPEGIYEFRVVQQTDSEPVYHHLFRTYYIDQQALAPTVQRSLLNTIVPEHFTSDLENDGEPEIIHFLGSEENYRPELQVRSISGELLWNKIFDLYGDNSRYPQSITNPLLIGDLDDDPDQEIVALYQRNFSYAQSFEIPTTGAELFNHDGTLISDLLLPHLSITKEEVVRSAILDDVDHDGKDELLVLIAENAELYYLLSLGRNNERTSSQYIQQKVLVIDGDGTLLHEIPFQITPPQQFFHLQETPQLATGNFDGDSELEIAVVFRSGVHVKKLDGTVVPGFPYETLEPLHYTITVGDIDNDNRDEILFYQILDRDYGLAVPYIIDHTGTVTELLGAGDTVNYFNNPVLSDLNSDGKLEILLPDLVANNMRVVNSHGEPYTGWPLESDQYRFAGVYMNKSFRDVRAVDIDGDCNKEILVLAGELSEGSISNPESNGGLFLWSHDGKEIALNTNYSIPNLVIPNTEENILIADFDNDRRAEVMVFSITSILNPSMGYRRWQLSSRRAASQINKGWKDKNYSPKGNRRVINTGRKKCYRATSLVSNF